MMVATSKSMYFIKPDLIGRTHYSIFVSFDDAKVSPEYPMIPMYSYIACNVSPNGKACMLQLYPVCCYNVTCMSYPECELVVAVGSHAVSRGARVRVCMLLDVRLGLGNTGVSCNKWKF